MRSYFDELPESLQQALDQLWAAGPGQSATLQAQTNLDQRLAGAGFVPLFFDRIPDSPIGPVYLAGNPHGMVSLNFGVPEGEFLSKLERDFGQKAVHAPQVFREARQQILAYLTGKRASFDLPYDIEQVTAFQKRVLLAALQIPRGQVSTYSDIARKIGSPKAVRAVGQALGRNPLPILIPCHRVIASSGRLGGYSGGGGLETKRKLLLIEGALLS